MITKSMNKSWLAYIASKNHAKVKLFCFPYAGSSCHYYRKWQNFINEAIQVCPVEIPGRGLRFHETAVTHLPSLIKLIARDMIPHLNKPFAFFGHSMGALIAFELLRVIEKDAGLIPEILFVSGCSAPQRYGRESPVHTLPNSEFIEKVKEMNGTPPELFENRELMQIYVPILKADFAMCENYSYIASSPLSCPIVAFGGSDDIEVSESQLNMWGEQTADRFDKHIVSGDHFFIDKEMPFILGIIQKELLKLV